MHARDETTHGDFVARFCGLTRLLEGGAGEIVEIGEGLGVAGGVPAVFVEHGAQIDRAVEH